MAISLTESAASRVRNHLENRGSGVGLRLGVTKTGCSGYAYAINYADEVAPDDVVFEDKGVTVVVDKDALPLIEIIPDESHEFFDYEAKYTAGVTREICPARINEELTQKAQSYAKIAHRSLFCKGYSRTDMILKNDEMYVLETNTIPGMTATSLFPQAAAKAGMSFSQVLDRLIELGLEEHRSHR